MAMHPDLIVVARRPDGLGARLCAILNAWAIAGALGLEFRFVWPRGADVQLREPRELFSDAFLDRFEIAASDCAGRAVRPAPTSLSLADAKQLCRTANAASMIDIGACFEVLAFADESADAAQARYRAGLSQLGWSRASQAILDSVSEISYSREYSAIHIRAGDIVSGAWRQFTPVDKYIPTPYVKFAIEKLSGTNRSPVVVVSDNDSYVSFLKSCFDIIRTPGDFVAGYTDLTDIQRAFADILVLSQARRVVAPRSSAFSRTAVNLGGRPALGVDDVMVQDDAQRRLRDGIAQAGTECSHGRRSLLARDICWYLDVFSDSLADGDQLALARRAALLDPDFCGALNRLAAALALAGNWDESGEASLRAERLAGMAIRHADPMVESLAASISAGVLALVAKRPLAARLLQRFGLASFGRRTDGDINRAAILEGNRRKMEMCEKLLPYQIHHSDVLLNLRFQIASLDWLTAADDRLREVARAAILPVGHEPPFLQGWRPSGFRKLCKYGCFPQVLRNVEILTIRIARAIGVALSSASRRSRRPAFAHVDRITTSASGLRWATGWAYDPKTRGREVAVAYALDNVVVAGDVRHLKRPDVAAALKDPRALNSGFEFPLPLAAPRMGDELQSSIRIL